MPKLIHSALIVLAIVLIASVLIQERSAGIGGAMGGADHSVTYHKRRGFEKFIFFLAIIVAIVFVALVLLSQVLF